MYEAVMVIQIPELLLLLLQIRIPAMEADLKVIKP